MSEYRIRWDGTSTSPAFLHKLQFSICITLSLIFQDVFNEIFSFRRCYLCILKILWYHVTKNYKTTMCEKAMKTFQIWERNWLKVKATCWKFMIFHIKEAQGYVFAKKGSIAYRQCLIVPERREIRGDAFKVSFFDQWKTANTLHDCRRLRVGPAAIDCHFRLQQELETSAPTSTTIHNW